MIRNPMRWCNITWPRRLRKFKTFCSKVLYYAVPVCVMSNIFHFWYLIQDKKKETGWLAIKSTKKRTV